MATRKVEGDRGKGEAERGKAAGSLDNEIDALFQLPLSEFTAARNALAGRLKKAGRADEADRVKALPKPSISASTVNQLYWKHRDAFERLLDVGEKFRKAQAQQLAGKSVDIRTPLEERRATLTEMAKLASATLRQSGSNAAPDTMRRITTTLEALSTYGTLPDAPRPGRLTQDVEAPGFETLAALIPGSTPSTGRAGPSRIIPFGQKQKPKKDTKRKTGATAEEEERRLAEERKEQRAAAKAAVQDAERALRDTRKDAQRAEEALKKAAARAKEAEKEKADAEQRLEKASAEAEAARQAARKIAAEAEEAAQAVEDAEEALEKAQRELQALEE